MACKDRAPIQFNLEVCINFPALNSENKNSKSMIALLKEG